MEYRDFGSAVVGQGWPLVSPLATCSLSHNPFPESWLIDEKSRLNLSGEVKRPYVKTKDSGKTAEDCGDPRADYSVDGRLFGANLARDERDSDSDWDSEDEGILGNEQNDDGEGGEDNDSYDDSEDDGDDDDEEEEEDEDSCSDTSSDEDIYDDLLLFHAREVYSVKSFSIFEHEYKKSRALSLEWKFERDREANGIYEYKVQRGGYQFRHHKVVALPSDKKVECSCNFFSISGILCSHALVVLRFLKIKEIPEQYLLKWHMKSKDIHMGDGCFAKERHRQIQFSSDDCLYSLPSRNSSIDKEAFEDEDYTDDAHIGAPLLRHEREIYLCTLADVLLEEYRRSEYLVTTCVSKVVYYERNFLHFEVYEHAQYDARQKVFAEPGDGTVKCSCRMFERTGILCSHALAVLNCLCVVRLPPQYICVKFLKDATVLKVKDIHGPLYSKLLNYFHTECLYHTFSELFYMAAANETVKDLVAQGVADFSAKIKGLHKEDRVEDKHTQQSDCPTGKSGMKRKPLSHDDHTLKNFVYREFKRKK